MKTTVSVYDFRQAFNDMGRGEQFSYDALGLIFDYLEEYEDSCDTEIELDPIAICCEYSEEHWTDIASNYNILIDVDLDDEEKIEAVVDYLSDNTMVVGTLSDGETIVYAQF